MTVEGIIGYLLPMEVPPARNPEEVVEFDLAQEPAELLDELPTSRRSKLARTMEALQAQLQCLRALAPYTSINRVRLAANLPFAAFLDSDQRVNLSLEALNIFRQETMCLAEYVNTVALLPRARDRRLPPAMAGLALEVAAIRCFLDRLRTIAGSSRFNRFLAAFAGKGVDPEGSCRLMLEVFLQRDDWRERDQVDMVLEHLEKVAAPDTACGLALSSLKGLLQDEPLLYENAISGLISEARGSLGDLPTARKSLLLESSRGRNRLGPARFQLLLKALARALLIPAEHIGRLPSSLARKDAAGSWSYLQDLARSAADQEERYLDLKNYEMASLYLLPEAKPADEGHGAFIQHLIEDTQAYRRILAVFYASADMQLSALQKEIDLFNRMPEHAHHQVSYREDELPRLLKAIFLRPDVVQAFVHREEKKSMYHVLAGLGKMAYLPRVLHEVHNTFGYVTPEVFSQIVKVLELDPAAVIRVLASYKEFTADPKGHIIIYVCKGTACFLRGQPHISRALSEQLQVERGQVSDQGIQYLEMDCFGVCHLAPVIKVGQSFLANMTAEDIPGTIATLLHGVSYENRLAFLNRIKKMLAPGWAVSPGASLQISQVYNFPAEIIGSEISLSAGGEVYARNNGRSQQLGTLVSRSLSFDYRSIDGSQDVGSLVVDETGQILEIINYSDPALSAELNKTIKPRAQVVEGQVTVRRNGDSQSLGKVNGNTVVIRRGEKKYASITFGGKVCRQPPEEEKGIPSYTISGEPADFVSRQDRLLLGFVSEKGAENIDIYEKNGGYQAVRRILGVEDGRRWSPEEIIAEVSKAGLRGRGGAGFPTGRKWQALYQAEPILEKGDEVAAPYKLIVANGDEGDPGAFMDRTLVQERPHQLLEGMIIAALAVAARFGVIYLRKEYEDAVRRLENALFQARRRGYLGENIFGVEGVHFDIEIRLGAGAFVAGEKRAIMRAIEGKPAEPTFTAVSNTRRGLWGKPTLLNNVETFANIPLILQKGGKWFLKQGYGVSGGSKIFSVAGIVEQTGLVEVRFGRTLRDVIEICQGIKQGKKLAGVQIGGPSGAILSLTGIREYLLDSPLDFDTFFSVGAMLGSGGLVFLGEDDDVVRLARHFTDWLAEESCGQCPSCLQGLVSLGETLDAVLQKEAYSSHIHTLWSKSDLIKAGARCGLGTTASNPVTSALRFFPVWFLHYLLGNERVNKLELLRTLEALHLLSRQDITVVRERRQVTVGHLFLLRKRFIPTVYAELQRIDQYRPPQERRASHFLHLLGLEEWEVGKRDVALEVDLAEISRHEECLKEAV
ncbi:MAG: NAD(P)H-dependent oxidoreductase subunit E [Deltaproteobacteria bacterium]|nr:NAD(P)H-dependent oxidoreductase subunit E [Deltaproteobacteria bacterium]